MPPVVDIKHLLSLETLRRKINWPNITEGPIDEGDGDQLLFTVHADRPNLPPILLYGDVERTGLHMLGFDASHAHYDYPYDWRATWWAVKLARDLVGGRWCLLEARDSEGQPAFWQFLPAGRWPDTLSKYSVHIPAGDDDTDVLIDPRGGRWRRPAFRRIFFNREPLEDQPDWSRYKAAKSGWVIA